MRNRPIQTSFRLNERENAHFRKQLAASGLSKETFLRSLIMGVDLRPRPPADWPELVRQVAAIGNNINQIARVANMKKTVDPQTIKQLLEMQSHIWQLVKGL